LASKKLQIWKLPPILVSCFLIFNCAIYYLIYNFYLTFQIVHLKRFQYLQGKWVKSHKVVKFPFKDFDPTDYLASVPKHTVLRNKELQNTTDNLQ